MNMNILDAKQLVIMESLLIALRWNSFKSNSDSILAYLSPFRAGITINRKSLLSGHCKGRRTKTEG